MKNVLTTTSLIVLTTLLISCGGGDVESNPPSQNEQSSAYNGPAPQTEDVQNFKVALWDNISTTNRCGACHTNGNQSPYFAERSDVNTAYSISLDLVNLASPNDSRLVTKVASGHNCWLSNANACGETMSQWVKQWSGDRIEITNQVELVAPVNKDPGNSKSFPINDALFQQHIYPTVSQYCQDCHNETSAMAQAPFFASEDHATAYSAAKGVINLDQPSLSRLVIRLENEFHNCWSDCQTDANNMLAAIDNFSSLIELDVIPAELIVSKAVSIADGIVASSGGRFESDLIAFYQFKAGEGTTAFDTSGIEPAANLSLSGDVSWLSGWGVQLRGGKAQASTASSKKLHDLINLTGEFTVEAWLTPANVVQEGPARIVSYSASDADRNFTLGQSQYNYDYLVRDENSNSNGMPMLSTLDEEEILQANLQHVVITQSPFSGKSIYVNGDRVDTDTVTTAAPLQNWDDSYALILGNEASGRFPWLGNIRMLALYNRALSESQVQQNFDVGVGEKFFLLFSIADLVNTEGTYVMFEVSQFDNYSYLFSNMSIVNLSGNTLNENTQISGVRIGINGKESAVGQVFSNISTIIQSSQNLQNPVTLSALGGIFATEKGAETDEFFLSFEQLGQHAHVRTNPIIAAQHPTEADTESPQIGMRNYLEINATMSQLTGISTTNSKVAQTFELVERQLPSIENIDTFISAQQMGITQLAIAYCDQAMESESIRSTWLPNVNFTVSPAIALSLPNRSQLTTPIISQLMPGSLTSDPNVGDVEGELNSLITELSSCTTTCSTARTLTIAKAACTAVLASATTLIQ